MSELQTTSKQEFTFMANELLKFNQVLNQEPKKEFIKYHHHFAYIPIRYIENEIRSIFGVFQSEIVHEPKLIGNAVVCSVHLKVYHPLLKEWICYAGTGAVPIQLRAHKEKNGVVEQEGAKNALDFEHIIRDALHKNIPAAKAFAFGNAAKQLGRRFGSDLNNDEMSEAYNVYGPAIGMPYWWDEAVKHLKDGGKIEHIEKKYNLSDGFKTLLMDHVAANG